MTELGKGRGAAPACAAQDERGTWRVAVVGYVVFCMVSVYLALLPEDVSAQERARCLVA